MLHHRGASLSKQHIAGLLFCHGTQTAHNSRVCHCLLFHERDVVTQTKLYNTHVLPEVGIANKLYMYFRVATMATQTWD